LPTNIYSPKNLVKRLHGWLYRQALPLIVQPPSIRAGEAVETMPRAAIIAFLNDWKERISGQVLDVGAGSWTYPRQLLAGRCQYTATDCFEHPNVDVVSDIHALTAVFKAESFDFVLCTDVLEHVSRPWLAARELAGVLKPGGTLLLTTPFNYRRHGNREVIDYWRFTEAGLQQLLGGEAGLRQIQIEPVGHPIFPFSYTVSAVKQIPS
jgi:SAM-dependent methyltransferase